MGVRFWVSVKYPETILILIYDDINKVKLDLIDTGLISAVTMINNNTRTCSSGGNSGSRSTNTGSQ